MFFYIVSLFILSFSNVYADECDRNYIIIHNQNNRKICVASAIESEEDRKLKVETLTVDNTTVVDDIPSGEVTEEPLEEIELDEGELISEDSILMEREDFLVSK